MDTKNNEAPFLHVERGRNIRYLCYSLLKNVRFNDEPVVPKILSEEEHDILGKIFKVERLPGSDIGDIFVDEKVGLKDKLEILLHVARQLKEIDKEGFVIFDRNGGNIRVLSWGEDGISTRQIDIEEMYDKHADCVYSSEGSSMNDELTDLFKDKGLNLWTLAIRSLSWQGIGAAERHGNEKVAELLSRCVNEGAKRIKNTSLNQFEKVIKMSLDVVEKGE